MANPEWYAGFCGFSQPNRSHWTFFFVFQETLPRNSIRKVQNYITIIVPTSDSREHAFGGVGGDKDLRQQNSYGEPVDGKRYLSS